MGWLPRDTQRAYQGSRNQEPEMTRPVAELVEGLRTRYECTAGFTYDIYHADERDMDLEAAAALERLEAENQRLRGALNSIASWGEGETVDSSFDEPYSAQIARAAIDAARGK
jgi:hypothetical protein